MVFSRLSDVEVFNLKTNVWRIISKMNNEREFPGSVNYSLICSAKKKCEYFLGEISHLLFCKNLAFFAKQINAKFHIVYASFCKVHFQEKKEFVKYNRKFLRNFEYFAKVFFCWKHYTVKAHSNWNFKFSSNKICWSTGLKYTLAESLVKFCWMYFQSP